MHKILILAALLLVAGVGAPIVHAWVITVGVAYTPVAVGGYTTVSWTGDGAPDFCTISGPTITASTPGASANKGSSYYIQVNGGSGSYNTGPINGNYTYRVDCINVNGGGGGGSGYNNVTVVPGSSDNCPGNPTAVTNGLQVPPGTYHVTAQGNNI